MSRLFDRLLVIVYVAVLALPAVGLVLGLRGRSIHGAMPPAPWPTWRVRAFVAETFQAELVDWFTSKLGFKGTMVSADNTLLYWVFRETKPGAMVRIGSDGVLFNDEDLNYYNRHGADLPPPAQLDALAGRIAGLQRRFAGEHRAFVPIVIPAKTSVWRDKVSDAWTQPLGDPRPSDVGVYRAMTEALVRHGVRYVDARALFAGSPRPRELLYGADARHWTAYGACLAMQDLTREINALTGRELSYDCPLRMVAGPSGHVDFDLWGLLNAWAVPRAVHDVPTIGRAAPSLVEGRRPSVLFVGTSFCWGLLRDAQDSGQFGVLHMNYYNRTFVPWPTGEHYEVKVGTPSWSATTLGNDVYVLDLFEGYLGAKDSYVDEFLDQLERAIAPPAGPVTAPPATR